MLTYSQDFTTAGSCGSFTSDALPLTTSRVSVPPPELKPGIVFLLGKHATGSYATLPCLIVLAKTLL